MKKSILIAVLLVPLGLAGVLAAATDEVPLEDRVSALEDRVAALESRLAAQSTGGGGGVPRTSQWKDKGNWRYHLRRGLTKDQVRTVLGEPGKVVEFSSGTTLWYYGYPSGGQVKFDASGLVQSWSEP